MTYLLHAFTELTKNGGAGAVAALAVRSLGTASQLVFMFVLARGYGADGAGHFLAVYHFINLAGVVVALGTPFYTLRWVSAVASGGAGGKRSVLFGSLKLILMAGFPIMLLAFGARELIDTDGDLENFALTIAVGAISLACLRNACEALKGIGHANSGIWWEFVFLPVALSMVVVVAWVYEKNVSIGVLVYVYVISLWAACCLAISHYLFELGKGDVTTTTGKPPGVPSSCSRPTPKALGPMWASSMVNVGFVSGPYLLLAFLGQPALVGIFGVCHRIVAASATINSAVAAVYAPKIAAEKASNQIESLWRYYRTSQVYTFASYIPIVLLILFFTEPLLQIFGREYSGGVDVLITLGVLRLVNAFFGIADSLLIMTGHATLEAASGFLLLAFFIVGSVIVGGSDNGYWLAMIYGVTFAARPVFAFSIAHKYLRN